MSDILTPISIWKDFDDSLELLPVTLGEKVENGVKFEELNFSGRDTGMGRVTVYGIVAYNEKYPSSECVLLLRDATDGMDVKLLSYFVKKGYSVLCVDYAGKRVGIDRYTEYPSNVRYANSIECGRHKDFVDGNAKTTCWYEWVSVGIYARKYLQERFMTEKIGLVGIKDGGEIAWKLACARKFLCAVAVNACGWRAYRGYNKYDGSEPEFDDERYRFIAGIDSQSYAPYVKCPMLLLCSTGDPTFNYDRAYDTFSRINPEFADLSSIAYSVNSGKLIDYRATDDMFLFLDSYVKDRHVFMPKPAEIEVFLDEKDNLAARVNCDSMGIIEKCGVYFSENNFDFATRDWAMAPLKKVVNKCESEYYFNVYEKSTTVFAVCFVVYSNGFTVWSKLAIKKLSGKFRNSRAKSKIIYSNESGIECFSVADSSSMAIGGTFLSEEESLPQIVIENGLEGVYSSGGLVTNKMKNPQFAPDEESILSVDLCSDEDIVLTVRINDGDDGKVYSVRLDVIGGVWQTHTLTAKAFKNKNNATLTDFTNCEMLTFIGDGKFALNNLMWL